MPLIVKGKTIVNMTELKNLSDDTVKPETKAINFKEIKRIEKPVIKEEMTVEAPSHYHDVHEGDLHKLINKKSDYLNDMLDLKNNK